MLVGLTFTSVYILGGREVEHFKAFLGDIFRGFIEILHLYGDFEENRIKA